MKLTTITQITVDGVTQGNGGASEEDRRNGFDRGGWALGAGDDETRTFITQTYRHADASPWSSARAGGCSPTPARTWRFNCSTHAWTRRA